MKTLIGILLILVGIVLGLYVGLWLCFIGGIVQVIEQVRAENLEALQIAIGVARIMFAGFCGTVSAFILIIPGYCMLNN